MKIKTRYIDPFSDFGFKKIFGSEPDKDLLIDFLNELLEGTKKIKKLSYANNEQLGKARGDRKAIFDLYCEGEEGEKFIIELQRIKQVYFKDRSLYYATFPIQEQGQVGEEWNFGLGEIFTICIMDFIFENTHPAHFKHVVKLVNLTEDEIFYDKLTFLYIEMPKFNKIEVELSNRFEKWLYLFKNLNNFTEIPVSLQERIFRKVFKIAEIANLTPEEMTAYEASLKDKRDFFNSMNAMIEEGIKEGEKRGKKRWVKKGKIEGRKETLHEVAKDLKRAGVDVKTIAQTTKFTVEEINAIKLD